LSFTKRAKYGIQRIGIILWRVCCYRYVWIGGREWNEM